MLLKTSLKMAALSAVAGVGLLASVQAFAAEITIWCWDPNFNVAIMKDAGEIYHQSHPDTTFNVVDFAKSDVEQKLQTVLASGTTSALPDIVLIEDYSAQKYLQSFPGAFAPMDGVVDYSKFAPYKVAVMTMNGKTYGMPFDSGVTGFFYRRDFLKQAGYEPKDLQDLTWDKYIQIGKDVVAKTGKKMLALDPTDGGPTRIVMQSGGTWYFDKDGNLDIKDNAPLKSALEMQAKVLNEGIAKPTNGWTDGVNAFMNSDVASVLAGVWMVGSIKSQPDQAGKWGVAPIPHLDLPGAVAASNQGGSSWYVLAKSPVKDDAIKFLNEVYANNIDFYQKILTERGAVGTLLAAQQGDAYQKADDFFGGEKVWLEFSKWLGEVPPVNYGVFTNELDSITMANLPQLTAGAPIDQVLDSIQSQAQFQIR